MCCQLRNSYSLTTLCSGKFNVLVNKLKQKWESGPWSSAAMRSRFIGTSLLPRLQLILVYSTNEFTSKYYKIIVQMQQIIIKAHIQQSIIKINENTYARELIKYTIYEVYQYEYTGTPYPYDSWPCLYTFTGLFWPLGKCLSSHLV